MYERRALVIVRFQVWAALDVEILYCVAHAVPAAVVPMLTVLPVAHEPPVESES